MRFLVFAAFIVVLSQPLFAQSPPAGAITNADVVRMVEAGLPPELIVASIRLRQAQEKNFLLTPDALIELKQKKVPDAVIAAMFGVPPSAPASLSPPRGDPNNPLDPHEAGVYLDAGEGSTPRLIRLAETTSTGMRLGGGWTSALTGGLTKTSMKYRVRDPQAERRTANAQPVFYVYGQDPRDLVLLKLERKGREREFTSMEMGLTGSSGPKGHAEFTAEKVAEGVYRLTIAKPLGPGEYGFGLNISAGALISVYDFGVDAPTITASRE